MNWPIDRIHPFPQIFPLSNCRKVSPSQYFAASHSKKIIKDCNLFTRCGVESQKSIAKYRNIALGRRDRDHIGNHNDFTERFLSFFFILAKMIGSLPFYSNSLHWISVRNLLNCQTNDLLWVTRSEDIKAIYIKKLFFINLSIFWYL